MPGVDPTDEVQLKEISFGRKELDPEQEKAYQEKIAQAKKGGLSAFKGKTPVGGVERPQIPLLTNHPRAASTPSGLQDGGVVPRPAGSPTVRPETQQQIEDFAKAQASQKEQEIAEGLKKEEDQKKVDKEEDLADLFNFTQQSEAERILNNKGRRKEIEARCEPMDFEDLLMKNEVQQKVPIIPGKFEVIYRSATPDESLFIKRFIAEEKSPSEQYTLEWYALCLLTCSLVSINGALLPEHRDKQGDPDSKMFREKLKRLSKMSGYIVSDLGVNYTWFDLRVRKLLVPEKVGNG